MATVRRISISETIDSLTTVVDGYLIDGRISDLPTQHGASMPVALRELLEEAVARGERRVAARGATYDLDVF